MGTLSEAARQLAGKVEVDFVDWHKACKDKVRRQVIVADALFESALDHLIQCRLSPKDEVLDQLLAAINLNNKTRLAYVSGFITKQTMQDLQHMHKTRNIFAHECKADSSNPKLVKEILALSTVKGREKQVTALNLMDFYFEAGKKCKESILKAINEFQAMAHTNAQKEQSEKSRPE